MWNNIIFGFLLIATVCTPCQSTGYPKQRPDNPLELPDGNNYDKINIIPDSASQQATSSAKEGTPEQMAADENDNKVITIPQVHEDQHENEDHDHHDDHCHHHYHGEDGAYNPHDDGTGWDIRKSIPGEPGRDYPTYVNVVDTSFTCAGKAAGYYADLETRCQIFRICTTGSANAFNSFLCPNGSIFNQAVLTCDWWSNVDCQGSPSYYYKNNDIGNIPEGQQLMTEIRKMLEAPMLNPFRPVHENNYEQLPITHNQISDTNNYINYQTTPEQKIVTVTEQYYTPTVIITTPKIQVSTFETVTTTGRPVIESSTLQTNQQYDGYLPPNSPAGNTFLDTNIQVGGNLFHSLAQNQNASSSHAQSTQHSGQIHLSQTLQTSAPLFTTGSKVNSTSGTLHLSQIVQTNHAQPLYVSKVTTSKQDTINHFNSQSMQPLFISPTISSGESNIVTTHPETSTSIMIPQPQLTPVIANQNTNLNNKLFLSQIGQTAFDLNSGNKQTQFVSQSEQNIQTVNTNNAGPEKISLIANGGQKEGGLLHSEKIFGTIRTSSGFNVKNEAAVTEVPQVTTTSVAQVIGGLNLQNEAQISLTGSRIEGTLANQNGGLQTGSQQFELQQVTDGEQKQTSVQNIGLQETGTLQQDVKQVEVPTAQTVTEGFGGGLQTIGLEQAPQQVGFQQVTGGVQKQADIENVGFQQTESEVEKQIRIQQSGIQNSGFQQTSELQQTITQTESPAIQTVTEGFFKAGLSKDEAIQAIDKLMQPSAQQGIQMQNNNNQNFGLGKLNIRFKDEKEKQAEINKQIFTGISKSIEVPYNTQGQTQQNFGVQNIGNGVGQHYARILNQGNEQASTGTQNFGVDVQNVHNQNVKQLSELLNQNAQNQGLHNYVLNAQNIQNTGIKDLTSGFNTNGHGLALDPQNSGFQNQAVHSNFGLQGQNGQNDFNNQNNFNFNHGLIGEPQNQGVYNQEFQSNFELQSQSFQNGYNVNNGFSSATQNQGEQNFATHNFGLQAPNIQNAYSTQDIYKSNANGGFTGSSPNFHEQNYQNFNYHTNDNGQNANYEVSKNGAAQNYKGESLSQHTNGQTHSSYSGHNYAYKESTKVEVVPSLGFTLTDELDRANYASAVISGLVQEKRGASAANFAKESISPSDVRHSSYQGPSSYLVPQSSVQHLSNGNKRQ